MRELPFNWFCPYCERAVTIVAGRYRSGAVAVFPNMTPSDGLQGIFVELILCPNPDCGRTTVEASHRNVGYVGSSVHPVGAQLAGWRLAPWGAARAFPEFVPPAIRADYAEACSIKDLSPKGAATLARRAVQGVVRGFWGITRGTLNAELEALKELVGAGITEETWDSIDAVRSIGNIGAHMEKDIDLIVEVDPGEADLLIGLVEQLIDDTYIARDQRQRRHRELKALKEEKTQQRRPAALPAPLPADE